MTTPQEWRWVGAVLCGGASRRMGRDKALIDVDGQSLASRSVSLLTRAGATAACCVGETTPHALRGLGLTVVADPNTGAGPLAGIVVALDWAAELGADGVCVLAVDLPALRPRVVRALADRCSVGDVAVAAGATSRPEPLCAVWSVTHCRVPVRQAFEDGQRSVHRVLQSLSVASLSIRPDLLHNANEPHHLRTP